MSKDLIKPENPAGFRDYTSDEIQLREHIMAEIEKVYILNGFQRLETPIFEKVTALGKFLPESDQPDNGIFALKDDTESWIATRFDLTAPLSRYYAQNMQKLGTPYRRYQMGPVFRLEQFGPGRYRQFYQIDFDTVGASSVLIDTEICKILVDALTAIGLNSDEFTVRFNNRKILNGILESISVNSDSELAQSILRNIDKIDRLGIGGVTELLGEGRLDPTGDFVKGCQLDQESIDKILALLTAGEKERDHTLEFIKTIIPDNATAIEGYNEVRELNGLLNVYGLNHGTVAFDPSLVRGLSYYTGFVFEVVLNFQVQDEKGNMKTFGSIAGGGRYDQLITRFTNQTVPSTGASIGVDRLMAALMGKKDFTVVNPVYPPVIIANFDKELLHEYVKIADELQNAGIPAEIYPVNTGLAKQAKYADRRKSPALVLLGSDEAAAKKVSVKNLLLGKRLSNKFSDRGAWLENKPAQATVPRMELVGYIREILATLNK